MIEIQYIIDETKSLLTIIFNKSVMDSMKAKCDDYLNFYQSTHRLNILTIFKADTGYRIIREPNRKKIYKISVKHPLTGIREFESKCCTYFIKKNGFIKILI